jgi:hypothetical protein
MERRSTRRSARVLLSEFVDATAGIDDLLLARIERMAVRADFDLQIVPERRARDERVPAAAGDSRLFVFRMDSGLHERVRLADASEKGAQFSHQSRGSQQATTDNAAVGRLSVRLTANALELSTKVVDNFVDEGPRSWRKSRPYGVLVKLVKK